MLECVYGTMVDCFWQESWSTQIPVSVALCPHGLAWDWVTEHHGHGTARKLWWECQCPVVTRLQAGWSRVWIWRGQETHIFSRTSRWAVGPPQPPVQWALGFFPGVKWRRHEVHSAPSSAKVKNEWRHTSAPAVSLWCWQGQLYL